MKRTPLLLAAVALLSAVLLGVLSSAARPKTGFADAEAHIVLRRVGHAVLRSVGDSSSPLPPVEQPEGGNYVISFPRSFSFSPDSLVAVINRHLAAGLPGSDYIVNVIERPGEQVVFGYSVLHRQKDSPVPCLGRVQPERSYSISIRFREPSFQSAGFIGALAAGGLSIALLVAGLRRSRPALPSGPREEPPEVAPEESPAAHAGIPLGRYLFVPAQQCLLFAGQRIALTGKESALLHLFAAQPNHILDRAQLQKIWEDEGVIVGRSLDVFVSRLRRKLEQDPALSIVNIHGKGYKLEIVASPSTNASA
ncbi:winged helix-turn-helix domain-containing protein [Flaviaesturariibacter amylovorans]|uniref:OmpR/PhoB-type domain-containing protein n=1 Tax=Flaviaesturariibacter amylovorans TaxID=1084520 RepID=A0ABP8HPK4_9BACT